MVSGRDGLLFAPDTVSGSPIREDQQYEGLRINVDVFLGSATTRLQIDIGFGDVITPAAQLVDYPTMLDFPKPSVHAYPKETVIAEKYEAMVALGMGNSRMKDFYDGYTLGKMFDFSGSDLASAIAATFSRRKTAIPSDTPMALTEGFANDRSKTAQWIAFVRRMKLEPTPFPTVVSFLKEFLGPVNSAAASSTVFDRRWLAGGPWK